MKISAMTEIIDNIFAWYARLAERSDMAAIKEISSSLTLFSNSAPPILL